MQTQHLAVNIHPHLSFNLVYFLYLNFTGNCQLIDLTFLFSFHYNLWKSGKSYKTVLKSRNNHH